MYRCDFSVICDLISTQPKCLFTKILEEMLDVEHVKKNVAHQLCLQVSV